MTKIRRALALAQWAKHQQSLAERARTGSTPLAVLSYMRQGLNPENRQRLMRSFLRQRASFY